MNGGVALCVEVDPRAHRPPHRRRATSTRRPTDLDDAVARCERGEGRAPRAERRAVRQRRRRRCPRCSSSGFDGRHRHRPDQRPRPAARLRPDRPDAAEATEELRATDPEEYVRRSRAAMAAHCAGDGRLPGRGRRGLRLRQQPARRGASSAASSAPSTTRASCPPTSGRCSARARARSAGWRSPAIRPTSPPPTAPCSRSSPTTSALARWIRLAGERVAFQGLPARICWLGYGERAPPRPALQRDGAQRAR